MVIKVDKINKFLDVFIGIVAALAFLLLISQWGLKLDEYYRGLFSKLDTAVLFSFVFETLLRFLFAPKKKGYLKKHWMDLIVLIPLVQFMRGIKTARLFIVFRQIIVLFSLFSRTKRLQKLISLLGLKPAQMLVASFAMTIFIGTFLLTLPLSTKDAQGLNFIDALFTSTSATCVTGLIVKDTGSFFSLFGQLVILTLIQVGGLGIMTFSITLFLAIGRHISRKETVVMQEVLDHDSIADIMNLVRFIAKMTFVIELWGVVFLFFAFEPYFTDPLQRLYVSVFHSISAFCNAGFSLFSDSLMRFARDVSVNLTVCFLIISGGLGFIVVKDLWQTSVRKLQPKSLGHKLHTKLVLSMTAVLLIVGTLCIFFAENKCALKDIPLKDKILISFFQSTTARTAGFNTLDIGRLTNASIFSLIVLMFIGASAGSTGGGIKTTTFWIILKALTSHLQNREDISVFKRKIPGMIVGKAWAVFVLSLGLVITFSYLLAIFEPLPLRDILFEVVSAFGTVGLSCGITFDLHTAGKALITILMFLGRLGPLTIVLAFSQYKRKINYTYAEERVMVG